MKTLRTELQLQTEVNEQGILELRLPVGFAGQTVRVTLAIEPLEGTVPTQVESVISPPKTSYRERMKKIQEVHPRAYEPWSKREDNQLCQLWDEGKSVAEISASLGRKKGAIEARLKKTLPQGTANRPIPGKMYKPAIHQRLIEAARNGEFVNYSEIVDLAEIAHLSGQIRRGLLKDIFTEITMQDLREDPKRPLLSAVVMSAGASRPGKGFFDLARQLKRLRSEDPDDEGLFWHQELRALQSYWQTHER